MDLNSGSGAVYGSGAPMYDFNDAPPQGGANFPVSPVGPDVVQQFIDAMAARGLVPSKRGIVADGKIHRCDANTRNGKGDGSYCLHMDAGHPAGWLENHQDGLGPEKWSAIRSTPMTAAEERKLKSIQRKLAKEREEQRERDAIEAAQAARKIWDRCKPAPNDHPYLVRKGVPSYGLRINGSDLVVAIWQTHGVTSLQYIYEDGSKRFLPGGTVQGGMFAIGAISSSSIVMICEGYSTAATVHRATGYPCLVAFDAGKLLAAAKEVRARLPNVEICICADDDWKTVKDGKPHNAGRIAANAAAKAVGGKVAWPIFPDGRQDKWTDFNDLEAALGAEQGRAEVKRQVELALGKTDPEDTNSGAGIIILKGGDDVEIAECVAKDMQSEYGQIVYDEGNFWRYMRTAWEAIADEDLWKAVHRYSRAAYTTPAGTPALVALNASRTKSVIECMARHLTAAEFFAAAVTGINCASGFIVFAWDGTPTLEQHSPDHRQRHTLPGSWHPGTSAAPPDLSLLSTLFKGCFRGDPDAQQKIDLVAEVGAAAALGIATKLRNPLAVLMLGPSAENGKTEVQTAISSVLPASAVSCVSASELGDERHIVGLIGKKLNVVSELSTDAIASEKFKAVITGDLVSGRAVRQLRAEFRPVAQHLFATNALPTFKGGIDRGVKRRLRLLMFNRTIPKEDRIKNIGTRIGKEEPDLLLALVVGGASRLIKNGEFTNPTSSDEALEEWVFAADPVIGWLVEKVKIVEIDRNGDGSLPTPNVRTRTAYQEFCKWASSEGYKSDRLPAQRGFTDRVMAAEPARGVEYRRTSKGRYFIGLSYTITDSSIEL